MALALPLTNLSDFACVLSVHIQRGTNLGSVMSKGEEPTPSSASKKKEFGPEATMLVSVNKMVGVVAMQMDSMRYGSHLIATDPLSTM